MATYTYGGCLDQAYQVNWKVKDVLGALSFDLDRPWLPASLSGGPGLQCLTLDEKRRLTHVEMGSYAHLFGFLEAFIAPLMLDLARDTHGDNGLAFEALTNFAAEEVKHIQLFREIRRQVDQKLGFALNLIGDEAKVARMILRKSKGAVLLLVSAIEWLTQEHYLSAMRCADELDPLTKEIFRCHWMEEAQHARLDHLEILRFFKDATAAERRQAVEDLIWLLATVGRLLQVQVNHDLANISTYLDCHLSEAEWEEVRRGLLAAKRHCFIKSGVRHPNFQELLLLVTTPDQRARIDGALELILQEAPTH
jgi:hypothetical protein